MRQVLLHNWRRKPDMKGDPQAGTRRKHVLFCVLVAEECGLRPSLAVVGKFRLKQSESTSFYPRIL